MGTMNTTLTMCALVQFKAFTIILLMITLQVKSNKYMVYRISLRTEH